MWRVRTVINQIIIKCTDFYISCSAVGHPQSNGHITNTTHHSVTTPTHFPGPIRKTSASAPTTPLHAPTTSALSPVSHVEAQGNNVLSPTKSPRSRRRSHEPVTAMLELGPANSLIKRLLPRNFKKPYKQNSLPEKTSVRCKFLVFQRKFHTIFVV